MPKHKFLRYTIHLNRETASCLSPPHYLHNYAKYSQSVSIPSWEKLVNSNSCTIDHLIGEETGVFSVCLGVKSCLHQEPEKAINMPFSSPDRRFLRRNPPKTTWLIVNIAGRSRQGRIWRKSLDRKKDFVNISSQTATECCEVAH